MLLIIMFGLLPGAGLHADQLNWSSSWELGLKCRIGTRNVRKRCNSGSGLAGLRCLNPKQDYIFAFVIKIESLSGLMPGWTRTTRRALTFLDLNSIIGICLDHPLWIFLGRQDEHIDASNAVRLWFGINFAVVRHPYCWIFVNLLYWNYSIFSFDLVWYFLLTLVMVLEITIYLLFLRFIFVPRIVLVNQVARSKEQNRATQNWGYGCDFAFDHE